MKYVVRNAMEVVNEGYDRFFFNTVKFLNSLSSPTTSFCLINQKSRKAEAEIHFTISGSTAVSLGTGSFGSFQFQSRLKLADLLFFIQEVENQLKSLGIVSVIVKSYPACYSQVQSEMLTAALLSQGYDFSYGDLTYYVELSHPIALRESEPERIKSAIKTGMVFSVWENADLALTHQILSECREFKGYPMTLDSEAFVSMFETFPDIYRIFKVELQNKVIAAAVTVKINEGILYNFYVGELPEFRSLSPTALLIHGLTSYAAEQGYKIFDLGIGTDKGKINPGLINFKENMGGIPSLKSVFQKNL